VAAKPDDKFRGRHPVTSDEVSVTLARVLTLEKMGGTTNGN
jgi:hypothetical protein